MKFKKIMLIIALIVIVLVVGIVIKISTINRDSEKVSKVNPAVVSPRTNSSRPNANVTTTNDTTNNNETSNNVSDEHIDSANSNEKVDLEINEKFFLTNINDIYINYEDYKNKTVSYEGFIYYDETYDVYVVARSYYCCGYDAYAVGLELNYNGKMPAIDKWVKVTGVIAINENDPEYKYPYLKVTSLVEMQKEGERFVYN